ncbi:MAG: hypothetical protein SGI73_12305 [Chloroflexota bacterium]|nr:hypothetical protein [Chloroflexota bacterium]
MAWRAQISDRPIRRLAILPTKPGILAAWIAVDRVVFLDLASGARVSDVTFAVPIAVPSAASKAVAVASVSPAEKTAPPAKSEQLPANTKSSDPADVMDFDLSTPPTGANGTGAATPKRAFVPPLEMTMRALLEQMRAPNGDYLPWIRAGALTIHSTLDGTARLSRAALEWAFDASGESAKVENEPDVQFVAFGFDRIEGIVAALDANARLHVYRGGRRVGVFETPLKLQADLQPELSLADGGAVLCASDGTRIALLDMTGKLIKTVPLHYSLGAFAIAPDAKTLVTGDLDAGVLRVYGGKEWMPTVQRFAVDLLADARRAQLIGTGGTSGAALGPIAVGAKGAVAFAIVGTICATNVTRMKPTPPPKAPIRPENAPRPDDPPRPKEGETKAAKG